MGRLSQILTFSGLFIFVVGLLVALYGLVNKPETGVSNYVFVGIVISIIGVILMVLGRERN